MHTYQVTTPLQLTHLIEELQRDYDTGSVLGRILAGTFTRPPRPDVVPTFTTITFDYHPETPRFSRAYLYAAHLILIARDIKIFRAEHPC
jgi:hypothetical protein